MSVQSLTRINKAVESLALMEEIVKYSKDNNDILSGNIGEIYLKQMERITAKQDPAFSQLKNTKPPSYLEEYNDLKVFLKQSLEGQEDIYSVVNEKLIALKLKIDKIHYHGASWARIVEGKTNVP